MRNDHSMRRFISVSNEELNAYSKEVEDSNKMALMFLGIRAWHETNSNEALMQVDDGWSAAQRKKFAGRLSTTSGSKSQRVHSMCTAALYHKSRAAFAVSSMNP
jgi:hypothetical protein